MSLVSLLYFRPNSFLKRRRRCVLANSLEVVRGFGHQVEYENEEAIGRVLQRTEYSQLTLKWSKPRREATK